MTRTSKTILFFGSGPVAAESLELLVSDFDIEAVVTKPQPPHHKQDFPVIKVAKQHGLKILTTGDGDELSELADQESFQSPLGLVIDYGILIGQAVIDRFPLGIINSHFSLLPLWRGADPISFAILNGDKQTGVSLMLIDDQLDEGPLLAREKLAIAPDATTPSLTKELVSLSHAMLIKTLPTYIEGKIEARPQTGEPSYSRKLIKADGVLDWTKPAAQLEREIRAFADWPRSRTKLGAVDVVITEAHVAEGNGTPGKIRLENKQLGVYAADGILVVDKLIPAGKPEMPAEAFLAGYRLG